MKPTDVSHACTRRTFALAGFALAASAAVSAPVRAAHAVGLLPGAVPLSDTTDAASTQAGPFDDLPTDPLERLSALCTLFQAQVEDFAAVYTSSVENGDDAYAQPMLDLVDLCNAGYE